MKSSKIVILLSAAVAAVAAFNSAGAAVITWSAPVTVVDEDIIQAGVIAAYNFSSTTTGTQTVTRNSEDVVFANTGTARTSGGITATLTNFGGGYASGSVWSGTPTDADFSTVMDSFYYTTNVGATGTITLTGLTAGITYSLQLLSSDDRGNGATRRISFNDGNGNSTTSPLQNTSPSFLGTFTAIGTSQVINAVGGGTSPSAIVNGLTIATVPEPSAVALLGVGLLAFAARRRR